MTFEEWVCENLIDKDFDHNKILKITDEWGIEDIKNAWDYQQERIDNLERWIAGIADDHGQIPDWIQQSARSLLAQEGE